MGERRVMLHVAPLPPGHLDAIDCPCGPIRSARLANGSLLVIHRLDLEGGAFAPFPR
jgi:hypothetical protein